MNINRIFSTGFVRPYNDQKQKISTPVFGLRMTSPLSADTVSFTGSNPVKCLKDGVSLSTARNVHEAAEPMQKKVREYFWSLFGDLVATEENPQNIIYAIKDRVKSARSIREKSAANQYNSKAEILRFMTDLNGIKIVMRDGSKKMVEKVLKRFFSSIQNGELELIQIENKRPWITNELKGAEREKYDYASYDFLEELRIAQEEQWEGMHLKEPRYVNTNYNDIREGSNYPGLHFLFKFPDEERPFEFVILGKDVNDFKDLDDKLYKILDNKEIDPEYKPLERVVRPLMDQGNEKLKELFNRYRADSFIFQREKEPRSSISSKSKVYFLPMMYDLPPELDFNELYKLLLDGDAKKAANLAKASKVSKGTKGAKSVKVAKAATHSKKAKKSK